MKARRGQRPFEDATQLNGAMSVIIFTRSHDLRLISPSLDRRVGWFGN